MIEFFTMLERLSTFPEYSVLLNISEISDERLSSVRSAICSTLPVFEFLLLRPMSEITGMDLTDVLVDDDVCVEPLLVGEGQPEDGDPVVHSLLEADHPQLGDKQPHMT